MDLRSIAKGSSKAQLMTIIMLVLFMLMLAVLFALAQLNITSNSVVQSLALSAASNNYGNLLRQSANNFAKSSLSKAITTLVSYEYNPSLRKGNLISNFTFYASNLMIIGILPNDTSGFPQNSMANLTFSKYNVSIASLLGFDSQAVVVNETRPVIFQTDPYSLRVSYTEDIYINASGNNYRYNIPVNVSVSLNNTPDLFYAQQGILRSVKLASLYNITSVVSGTYAASGNTQSYAYGTVLIVPSNQISSATCPLTSTPFSAAPYSSNIIIATYNALSLTPESTCLDNYAGLITYIAPTILPVNIPYLVYPASSNVLSSISSGSKMLLYGPGLATLDIENLRSAVMSYQYFASPFTSSYIDRANANFAKQSPNGIFTFSNYDTQSPYFNGQTSNVQMPNMQTSQNTLTVSVWAYPENAFGNRGIVGQSDSNNNWNLLLLGTGYDFVVFGINDNTFGTVTLNNWAFFTVTYNSGAVTIYVNGNKVTTYSEAGALSTGKPLFFGYAPGETAPANFNGLIANAQVYNSVLSGAQVQQLYTEGISGVPIPNANLIGWWPLNGDANDYSGNGNNGVPASVSYTSLLNYSRDSIFNAPVPYSLSPLPGLLSCSSSSTCGSNTLPQLYLSYMPLLSQGTAQTAGFIGQNSYISLGKSASLSPDSGASGVMTLCMWYKVISLTGYRGPLLKGQPNPSNGNNYEYTLDQNGAKQGFTVWTLGGANIASYASAQQPAVGQWFFSCFTYNYPGSSAYYYLNGVQHAATFTAGTPATAGTGALVVGAGENVAGSPYSNVDVANLQIYSTVLTASQIQQLYGEGIDGMPFSGNLVGWWPLNGDAKDYSGDGLNGIGYNVIYPYLPGTYNSPGLSTIASPVNEWQALGLANT